MPPTQVNQNQTWCGFKIMAGSTISTLLANILLYSNDQNKEKENTGSKLFKELLLYRNETIFESNQALFNSNNTKKSLTSKFKIDTKRNNIKSSIFVTTNLKYNTAESAIITIEIDEVSINLAIVNDDKEVV